MGIHVDVRAGSIQLYGSCGLNDADGSFDDGDVADALSELRGQRAKIYINSPGGSVAEGLAIYNQLARYKGGVDTFVDGIAASIASVIFLAGRTRTMASNSRLMIHRAHMLAIGNGAAMDETTRLLFGFDQTLLDVYSEAMPTVSRDEIERLMHAETWFTAQEAVDIGLATSVSKTKSLRVGALAAWFQNPPADLLAQNGVVPSSGWAARSRMMRASLVMHNLYVGE